MKILATLIAKELKNAKHYAVYEPELARVLPDGENREAQIASFAKKHGWRLRHYTDSAKSFIKSHLAEIRLMALFLRVRFSARAFCRLTLAA